MFWPLKVWEPSTMSDRTPETIAMTVTWENYLSAHKGDAETYRE